MDSISNARDYEKELTRIFNRFNNHYWNNELPEVIITFVPTKGAYGHMTVDPVWQSNNDEKYELNISAYSINRKPEEICTTLLHEQCHLYNNIHGINDCSNHGRYHNGYFKHTAEQHGLVVSKNGYHGWSTTVLTDEAKRYVKKLNVKKFEYVRINHRSYDTNLKRYSCPKCHIPVVYVSSPQAIQCALCDVPLVYTPIKKAPRP